MNYKKYNIIMLCVIFLVIFLVSIFNYLIDPFAVFGTENMLNVYKPHKDRNQRISKIPELKLYKKNLDAIWIGSSRTGLNTNDKYEKSVLNVNIKSMTINGGDLNDSIIMAENAVFVHPEIKTIYFGVDFPMLQKSKNYNNSIEKITNKKIIIKDIVPLIFSYDTLEDSIYTIIDNFKIVKEPYGEEKQYEKKVFRKFKNCLYDFYNFKYLNYELDFKKIDRLKNFVQWANAQNIDIVLFAPAMHITERIIINNAKKTDILYQYRKTLAQIQPYYDFTIIDKYTTEIIRPEMQYFRDAVHLHPPLRKKVSRKVFGLDEDFGVLVTNKNVKKLNIEDKKQLNKYIKQNKDLVEQVKEWCK